VQYLRRLVDRRGARQEEARFVVEGPKLLGEAVKTGAAIEAVFVDPEAAGVADLELAATCGRAGARVREVQPGVLRRVCDTVTPQPLAGIVRAAETPLEGLGPAPAGLVVVCAEVRDPGNLGTIIRSAAAAGAAAVICCPGSVDLYNPKTVRATAGALFHVPLVTGSDALDVLAQLAAWGLRCWGTSPRAERVYTDVDLAEPAALVLGNESWGLSESLMSRLDATLRIPMAGTVESLNVATAAAVVCFEAARQRAGRAAAGTPA
jgi:TrmH family RNA methyltransferase